MNDVVGAPESDDRPVEEPEGDEDPGKAASGRLCARTDDREGYREPSDPSYYVERVFESGRIAAVAPLTYGRARIVAADLPSTWEFGYDDGW